MTILQISKLEEFEERHPGACRQMEAMFKAFLPLHVVAAVIRAQYGEHLCRAIFASTGGNAEERGGFGCRPGNGRKPGNRAIGPSGR